MLDLNFRPRLGHVFAAGVVFLVCLLITPWVESRYGEGYGTLLLLDVLRTVGAGAAAVLGVGVLVEVWWRRRWKRITQLVAVDLLDQVMRESGGVTASAAYILLGDRKQSDMVSEAFRLPWTLGSARLTQQTGVVLRAKRLAGFDNPRDVYVRALSEAETLASMSKSMREATVMLDKSLPKGAAIKLLGEVVRLDRAVQALIRNAKPASGLRLDAQAALMSIEVPRVFRRGLGVALQVHLPFKELRARVADPELLMELTQREALAEQQVKSQLERQRTRREREEWRKQWAEETAEILDEMDAGLKELERLVDDWPESGPDESQ